MEYRNHNRLHAKLSEKPVDTIQYGRPGIGRSIGADLSAKVFMLDSFREPSLMQVEAAKQEFVVIKKSTGEVVDAFDTIEAAEALVEKHRRQKKATLIIKDTLEI